MKCLILKETEMTLCIILEKSKKKLTYTSCYNLEKYRKKWDIKYANTDSITNEGKKFYEYWAIK